MSRGESPSIPSKCLERRIGVESTDVIKARLIERELGTRKRALVNGLVLRDTAALVDAAIVLDAGAVDLGGQGAQFEGAGDAGLHGAGFALPEKPVLHHRRRDVGIAVGWRLD